MYLQALLTYKNVLAKLELDCEHLLNILVKNGIFIKRIINKGSYMSAHVLLNLLHELGRRDKMRGLPSILSLFRNEFNKFNNTRARMLDPIYHMIKSHFCRKKL